MSMDPEAPSLIEQVAKVAEPPLTRAYLQRVTADRDDLAREAEQRGQDIAQWQIACARHQREHFDAKAEAERLRGERDYARGFAETLSVALSVGSGRARAALPWEADAPEGEQP